MRRALCTALLLTFAASSVSADDAAFDLPLGDPARREKTLAPSLDVVLDARTGAAVSPAEVAARLAKARLVFLGESHTNAEFHRVQLQVIRELARAGRQPSPDTQNAASFSASGFGTCMGSE